MQTHLNEETYPHKVSAVYPTREQTESVAKHLKEEAHLTEQDIKIVPPQDDSLHNKLQPEDKGVRKTLSSTHIILAALGATFGFLVATYLDFSGVTFVLEQPFVSYAVLCIIFAMLGMFAAGLISLRPDQDPLMQSARDANQHNKWVLIVHAKNKIQSSQAKSIMRTQAESLSSSF
ncbi:hypothetical protein [Gayadomonas joobiniege]|uniref:hypothetical protein n=1 Tax=Gayadomonas joobiniege TaxID=1234606 RepID=UPI0003647D6F|nr:hypothetical protein [Gayadomonas joobiniege]